MNERIYLDYNATTPLAPEVIAAMTPFLTEAYGNPSTTHWAGLPARDAVEKARSQVAGLLCCDPTEVVFTSGGTEANNHALKGLFFSRQRKGMPFHIITSRIEHPAVSAPCRFLESLGAETTYVPVDRHGMVDPDDVRRAVKPHTAVISVMHANNETGAIQPIAEIAAIARQAGAVCHADAAQSVGKIPTEVDSLGVDLLSVAGHKLYGPKGVGALYIREGIDLEPFMHGAGHEAGRRAGTENVLQIVGLGAACELAQAWVDSPVIAERSDRFWSLLKDAFGDRVVLNGHPARRLPNTLNVSFLGRQGREILSKTPHVAASTGSACHEGGTQMSPVLEAMGVSEEVGAGAVRFSLGRNTTLAEIENVVGALKKSLSAY